ncbi:MAG: hypothetical protein OQK98_02755 [Gammaproteobacteria bacterium]|nr:hypothetical protein [Gammaproteobacteria bacterium]
MKEKIRNLLDQISELEGELRSALHDEEGGLLFKIKGKRIEFERDIKQKHRKLKMGIFRWIVTNRPQNLITGPIIYGMFIPLVIMDILVSFYQATCFPIYGVQKVRRGDYMVYDRQHLEYLNFIEKFHCTYCAYGTGLVAYMSEILARTEQYFCPIKHARKMHATHARYERFIDYGEAIDYETRLEEYRKALGKLK